MWKMRLLRLDQRQQNHIKNPGSFLIRSWRLTRIDWDTSGLLCMSLDFLKYFQLFYSLPYPWTHLNSLTLHATESLVCASRMETENRFALLQLHGASETGSIDLFVTCQRPKAHLPPLCSWLIGSESCAREDSELGRSRVNSMTYILHWIYLGHVRNISSRDVAFRTQC